MTTMSHNPSPYDTGARLEPSIWVDRRGGRYFTGRDDVRPSEPDDFGKVDFDDDGDSTRVTVWVEPVVADGEDTGDVAVHLATLASGVTIVIDGRVVFYKEAS